MVPYPQGWGTFFVRCAVSKSRLTITLEFEERSALTELAEREVRSVRDQAHYMLRAELERRGLLSTQLREPQSESTSVGARA